MTEGQRLEFATPDGTLLLQATVTGHGEFGERLIRFIPVEDFSIG